MKAIESDIRSLARDCEKLAQQVYSFQYWHENRESELGDTTAQELNDLRAMLHAVSARRYNFQWQE